MVKSFLTTLRLSLLYLLMYRYTNTPEFDDRLVLYCFFEGLMNRVNASVTEIPDLKSEPVNSTKWDDFPSIYDDFEIGLLNPVDKKVNSVKAE